MADTLATDYQTGIVNDMIALEWLEEHWEDIADWDMLEMLMKIDDIEAGAISSARYMVDDSGEHWDNYGGPVDAFFNNDVLDIEAITKTSAAGRSSSLDVVQALITFGGPNAWIISADNDGLRVLVNWGGDSVDRWISAPLISSHLFELGRMITGEEG
jgi:hypothetical protein